MKKSTIFNTFVDFFMHEKLMCVAMAQGVSKTRMVFNQYPSLHYFFRVFSCSDLACENLTKRKL